MRKKIQLVIILGCLIGIGYIYTFKIHDSFLGATQSSSTSALTTSTTAQPNTKIRVLIVPGHEPDNGGTNFQDMYERNLVVTIGQDLQQFLNQNNSYQTFITRDAQNWDPTFASYFQNEWNSIITWEQKAKTAWKNSGLVTNAGGSQEVANNAVVNDAIRLYGIMKWAGENNINLVIHLHLNNYPEAMAKNMAGKYSGLVMYTPATDLQNSVISAPIAQAIFHRLSLYTPISNLPVESQGLEQDDQLIAMGAYNTASMPSILIEYDYIYEPQLVNPNVRAIALKDFAYQTYLGLQDYETNAKNVTATSSYNPVLVYDWQTPVAGKTSDAKDIYAMQTALIMNGSYPPAGTNQHDCPHSGKIGACTEASITAFQKKMGIVGEGIGGTQTFNALQKIYRENN